MQAAERNTESGSRPAAGGPLAFVRELKRRNVFRVAAAYAVVAWLLLQAADILLSNFGAPDWVFKSFAVLLALGFPLALILSWAYELTPEGVRRSEEVSPAESVTPRTGRRIDRVIVIGLVAVIALLLIERLWPTGREVESPEPTAFATAQPEDLPTERQLQTGIAVLPFANLSPDPDNDFFAIGVQEDILTFLARAPDLRVISRTSVSRYRDTTLAMAEIARQLDVSHVLEGSVRRAGDQVRVTVQLIEAETDRHLWAEHYDRHLADVFLIQSDIARAVAGQLQARLSAEEVGPAGAMDTSPEVYDLVLRARGVIQRLRTRDTVAARAAIDDLVRATELDPDYLPAWEELLWRCAALVHALWRPEPDCETRAREALTRIEQLATDPASVELARARIHYFLDEELDAARQHVSRVVELQPSNSEALRLKGRIARRQGHYEEAVAIFRRLVEVDPANDVSWANLFWAQWTIGDAEGALATMAEAIDRLPHEEVFLISQAESIRRHTGDRARLRALLPGVSRQLRSIIDYAVAVDGLFEDADQAIAWLEAADPADEYLAARAQYYIALRLAHEGREDEARARLLPMLDAALDVLEQFDNDHAPEVRNVIAQASLVAAAAGECGQALALRERALNRLEAVQDVEVIRYAELTATIVESYCGDPAAAWASLQGMIRQSGWNLTEWHIAQNLMYQDRFGHLPEFQEFLRELGREI